VPNVGDRINVDYRRRMATLLTSRQAALRLGVKVETLYAYVSRGLLERRGIDAERHSLFDAAHVEALARRGRPRLTSRGTTLSLDIETRITAIDGRGPRYRGHLATELARTHTFEQVAELLWLERLPNASPTWRGRPIDLPAGAPLGESLQIVAARAGAGVGRDSLAMAEHGRRVIASLVDSLPLVGAARTPRLALPAGGEPLRATIAGRLWTKLAPRRPDPGMVGVLNAALVLLADHELAASTLAVRVAASTRAGAAGVVAAGLGALSGPLHGGESRRVHRLLDAAATDGPAAAIDAALGSSGRVPGFGQPLYVDGDPRARVILDLLRAAAAGSPSLALAEALLDVARRRVPPPNVDFAIAVLCHAATISEAGGEAVFATARIAGWLAHAVEEYAEQPLRFRPRATYVGD
jgi:citrate synthase